MAVFRKDGTSRKQDREDRKQRDDNFDKTQQQREEFHEEKLEQQEKRMHHKDGRFLVNTKRRKNRLANRTQLQATRQAEYVKRQGTKAKKNTAKAAKSLNERSKKFDFELGPATAIATIVAARAFADVGQALGQGLGDFSLNEGQPVVSSYSYAPSNDLTVGDINANLALPGLSNFTNQGVAPSPYSYDVSSYVW